MRDARFWLEPVSAVHPSGDNYSTAFALGLRNWTVATAAIRQITTVCGHE